MYLDRGVIRFSEVEEKRTNVTSEDLSKYQAVDPGDFVLNNQQAWRGSVGVSNHSGIVSPAYLVLSLSPRLYPGFANLLFRERVMVTQYLVCSRGVGSIQRNLYWPHLKRVVFPSPPLPEQTAIVEYLNKTTADIDTDIARAYRLIELLREYRIRLIADVVTGKLDVREAAAACPARGRSSRRRRYPERHPRHRPRVGYRRTRRHSRRGRGMTTDTSERGLERLICTALVGHPCEPPHGGHRGQTARRLRRGGLERRQLPRPTSASTASIWSSSRPFCVRPNPRLRNR